MLYGFYTTPPLDVEIAWSETHDTLVQTNYHKARLPPFTMQYLLLISSLFSFFLSYIFTQIFLSYVLIDDIKLHFFCVTGMDLLSKQRV